MKIEKARMSDIPRMHQLINYFADRGQMLPRALSEMYENIRDFFVARNENGDTVGCVALHINWSDLAEVKSLAVSADYQGKGIGTRLVRACITEAKSLGVDTVFCLTYKPEFFEKIGFKREDKSKLPRKVWTECYRCPKFPDCDEVALVYQSKPNNQESSESDMAGETNRTTESRTIYEGRAFKVRVDKVTRQDGRITTRDIVEHSNCICAVVLDDDGQVVLVRQYRHAVGKALLEIPAGSIDPGESPAECVRRELQEEIGYVPSVIEDMGGFYAAPGYSTEYLHLYLATGLVRSQLIAEDTGEIEVVRKPLSQIPELIASGEIQDAKSIAGLLRFICLGKKSE